MGTSLFLTILERIDRLIVSAESRRNMMLREIDRHRAALGEAVRRRVNEIDGELRVIETEPLAVANDGR